jgi:peroxin-7
VHRSTIKLEWSPYEETKLAVATSQNFGFVGAGQQIVLEVTPEGIREVASWYSRDALYDCAWSEENENHLVSSSGDGSIKLWDTRNQGQPVRSWQEHEAEVHSIDWNINVRTSTRALFDSNLHYHSQITPYLLRCANLKMSL